MPVEVEIGDILDISPNSVLVHACNPTTVWGMGFGLTLKNYSEQALWTYLYHTTKGRDRLRGTRQRSLAGTCFFILPLPPPIRGILTPLTRGILNPSERRSHPESEKQREKRYWIAVLFTPASHKKKGAGRGQEVAKSIEDAWMDMNRQIKELTGQEQAGVSEPEATNRCAEDYNYKMEFSNAKEGIDIGRLYTAGTNEEVFGLPQETVMGVVRKTDLDLIVIRPSGDARDADGRCYMSKEMEAEANKENLKPAMVKPNSKPEKTPDCEDCDLERKSPIGVKEIHKRKLNDPVGVNSNRKRRRA